MSMQVAHQLGAAKLLKPAASDNKTAGMVWTAWSARQAVLLNHVHPHNRRALTSFARPNRAICRVGDQLPLKQGHHVMY